MTSTLSATSSLSDENSRHDLATSIDGPRTSLSGDQLDLAATLKLPSNEFLSPIPTANKQQHTFSLSDLGDLDTLGLEVPASDITVAANGSYLETSSGSAARELKRRYDQLAGVGPSVRSPYAITGFVNQHGKSMYRIGHREQLSAPAASAAEVEERVTQPKASTNDNSQSPRAKRRSRLSMHFLQPAMFTKNTAPPPTNNNNPRPPTATSSNPPPRKLQRRTRSIPDLASEAEPGPTFAVTGRQHSQSVTAADLPRPSITFQPPLPLRRIDAFGELMEWSTPGPSSSASSTYSGSGQGRPVITNPFGHAVAFTVPAMKTHSDRLPPPPPRVLREMQSFESGLTARQDDSRSETSSPEPEFHKLSRPPSAIRLSQITTSSDLDDQHTTPPPPEPDQNISPESLRLSSHYSTEVFNVLQTYRGLPLFDTLADEPTTVIKLSLTADSSAAPRDDPRFVIWGEVLPEQDVDDHHSTSRDSLTDPSSSNQSLNLSRRRSSKVSKPRHSEASSSNVSLATGLGQRVLLAATIERWIAQLTSDLNYDELLNFFLTYRTYVSSVDLCHLLICRFHWALQKPSSNQDETVRRIVRVRTFVAIRYWLLTFFTVDFIPNRELRLLIADWLNTLLHDPVLKQHNDGIGIIRRLAKVAKECKRAHTRATEKPKQPTSPPRSPPADASSDSGPSEHLLGKSFAQAVRKTEDDESDLDLDFLPDEAKGDDAGTGFQSDPANAHLTVGHSVFSAARPTSLPLSSFSILQRTEHAPGPAADENGFIQNHHGHGHHSQPPVPLPIRHSALSRAFVHTIGRLGRWKRVLNPRSSTLPPKPTTSISSSSALPIGVCGAGVSAFDLEISASSRDLLARNMNGGNVEEYLKLVEPPASAPAKMAVTPAPAPSTTASVKSKAGAVASTSQLQHYSLGTASTVTAVSPSPVPPVPPIPTIPSTSTTVVASTTPAAASVAVNGQSTTTTTSRASEESVQSVSPTEASVQSEAAAIPPTSISASDTNTDHETSQDDLETNAARHVSVASTSASASIDSDIEILSHPVRAQSFRSFRSNSTESFGAPLTSDGPLPPRFHGPNPQWQFDVVSIDELDFSDTSSLPGDVDVDADADEPAHPPGLPGLKKSARKLPMRRDFEFVRRSEVSSMGIVSHESMRDSYSSSTRSESEASSRSSSAGGGMQQPLQRWQMKSLQRTFESSSNHSDDKGDVEAALRRLEGQINPKVMQEKAEKVDGWVKNIQDRLANGDYEYESSIFSQDEVEGFIDEVDQDRESDSQPEVIVSASEENLVGDGEVQAEVDAAAVTPVPTQTVHQLPPGLEAPSSTSLEPKPAVEDVVPLEILQSRMSTTPSSHVDTTTTATASGAVPVPSAKFTKPNYRSFILGHSAETLAKHYSMIDRELFMSVKFEELVTEEWIDIEEVEVLDWAMYLKDRARWKVEGRYADKTTALAAVRGRFNLMVAFVASEIICTSPQERPALVSKFVRIAWKCYTLLNFHTLTAIIVALQSDWVSKAMKKPGWGRIGTFEARMLRDLKQFTSPNDDFKFMRQVVESVVDAKPLDTGSHGASVVTSGDSQSGKGKVDTRPVLVPTACIPFIGIYLSQLRRLNKLPALIDPTAPNHVVGIDPITAVFDPPARPEVFSTLAPLPPSMHLEPLINVHKQRRIADVIKSLVAGQHLASRVQFDIDKKLFQRCLKLRGLDAAYLQRALAMYSD